MKGTIWTYGCPSLSNTYFVYSTYGNEEALSKIFLKLILIGESAESFLLIFAYPIKPVGIRYHDRARILNRGIHFAVVNGNSGSPGMPKKALSHFLKRAISIFRFLRNGRRL